MSRLASEESLALDVEQQLGLEIRKLTVQIQVRRGTSLGVGGVVVMVVEQLKCLGIATERMYLFLCGLPLNPLFVLSLWKFFLKYRRI